MKNATLLFAIKCSLIIYLVATTNIEQFTQQQTVSRVITKGFWKVNCNSNNLSESSSFFSDYTFTFNASGKLTANKNGIKLKGHWIEDNITNKVTLNFSSNNYDGNTKNNLWFVKSISQQEITLQNAAAADEDVVLLSAL
jgi:hypothetical protein